MSIVLRLQSICLKSNKNPTIKVKKKEASHKPGSVHSNYSLKLTVIYLGLSSLTNSIDLPSKIGRAALKPWFTWSFSP